MKQQIRKTCGVVSEQDLVLDFYRELDAARSVQLKVHLSTCPSCREASEQISATLVDLKSADVSVTPEAAERFARRVGGRLERPRLGRAGAWGGALAAAAVVLSLAVYPQQAREANRVETTRPVSAEMDILEHLEFLQDMDLLDDLDLLMALWPQG